MMSPRIACLLLLVLVAGPVPAVIETYEFSDEALEQRYHKLSNELRCPKCQNQNIADSNAPIAKDLRQRLFRQLEGGASDQEILDYMVARYGEFVRYRPRFNGATAVLWLAPLLLLIVGVIVVLLTLRGSRDVPPGEAGSQLSAEENRHLRSLLNESEKDA